MTSEEPTKPSDEAVEPTSSKKITSKKCEMCNQNEFKYKCPRCSLLTCSLACCRQHKTERNCSGERDKTKFVDKEEFDEQLLLSDYRFLEEQSRLVDNFQRTLEQVSKPVESTGLKPFHSAVYDQLRKFVYHKFGIRMQLMPAQSTRHLYNRTRFNRQQGLVSWSIEFVFYLNTSSSKYFRFNSKNYIFSSKSSLNQVLNNFYNKFKSDLFNSTNRELDQKFCHIFETGDFKHDMSILYEIVDLKARQRYFVALDLVKSLEENLLNKTIIEYPSLFIVRNQDLADFDIREYNQLNDPIIEMVEEGEKYEDGTDEEDDDGDEGKLIHPEVEENGTSRKFKREHEQDQESSKKFKSLDTIELRTRDENEELEDGEI